VDAVITRPTIGLTRTECWRYYHQALADRDQDALRLLCRTDRFFLGVVACRRLDLDHDWLFARCHEVDDAPDGRLDLWAREHYKSTLITFLGTIQDILRAPDESTGIFSCTRPIAKGFASQIKTELESNEFLKSLFPDVLWRNPQRESPRWSLDEGLLVKRTSNPKELTVECSGLIDGMPTSKHYDRLIYDDVITERHVTSPEMIEKVNTLWALSLNLGARGGVVRYAGTRYHANDTYRLILDRQAATLRMHPATVDGTPDGAPVLLTRQQLDDRRRKLGPYVFACQQLLDPLQDSAQGLKTEWLRYHNDPAGQWSDNWNLYLLCDPANEKKRENDYTVMAVVALGDDNNIYLIDAIRDRLNLVERTAALFRLHRRYKPVATGYEQYGMQSDIQHLQYVMEQEKYRFSVTPLGGSVPKNDRIRRLIPPLAEGRVWLPRRLLFTDYEGRSQDFIRLLLDHEYTTFPVGAHDDMLDCISRIMDPAFSARHPAPRTLAGVRHNTSRVNDSYNPLAVV